MLPILISTPHSSGHAPRWILDSMSRTGESESELLRRLFREGDPYTDSLFSLPEADVVLNAPASRFVADLNRERGEAGENGVIKLTDFERRPFYPPEYALSEEERERRLSLYYDPYHAALDAALRGVRKNPIRFFIDGHSMTARGPAIGPDRGLPRPAICVGNFGDAQGEPLGGPVSCPPGKARRIRDFLEESLADLAAESGLPVGARLNTPFDGGHILKKYSSPPYGVPGVMIEVNRALYLDEVSLLPVPGRISRLSEVFAGLAREMVQSE